ncbi:hypothetical protein BDF20DRAFT_910734 [Mycotypha africana]|uniref:uncharacterized protein n=1 Tax=Mycotypha africana TaxID=64632 RepID=UPI0023000DE5|nr:uncharacterized protein BDF20DRAFT_910734 [Mycotypha africana]KAI8988211.1 hypothetical protein BDF20DRAFT_910734 [Mycotypha africana]
MASFNTTKVYLNTRKRRTMNNKDQMMSIYRVPVPLVNEKFYFNQEAVQVIVYQKIALGSRTTLNVQEADMASVHLTNKRLIFLAQSTSIAPPRDQHRFDTCEFRLSEFRSLKTTLVRKKRLRFDIKTLHHGDDIRVDIKFINKEDAVKRRDALRDYLKMATNAIASSLTPNESLRLSTEDSGLPSYFEAIHSSTHTHAPSPALSPPAYH